MILQQSLQLVGEKVTRKGQLLIIIIIVIIIILIILDLPSVSSKTNKKTEWDFIDIIIIFDHHLVPKLTPKSETHPKR